MKARELELASFYLFFDLIILNMAILIMAFFRIGISLNDNTEISLFILQGNLSAFITYFLLPKKNPYLNDSFLKRFKLNTKRILIFLIVSTFIALLVLHPNTSIIFILEYTVLFYAGELIFHWLLFKYVKYKRKRGINTNHVIMVGLNETSRLLRNAIESDLLMGYRFVGFVDNQVSDEPDLIGHPDNLASLIQQYHAEMVFVSLSMFTGDKRLNEYLRICNDLGVHLRLIPENQHWDKSRINQVNGENLVIINPQKVPMDNSWARITKRLFDIVFSGMCIIFLFSWLFPILAIVIKLNSKGPVFFVQKRTGINNRIFNCIKFRSMTVNGESDSQQATVNDSRITSIGRIMRKTNLDELPQFLNVFRGQMSVVGPRPHMLKHTDEFSDLVKHYLIRHYVRPGITGWAQVNGYRGITDEHWKLEKRVEYDMAYIEQWNLWWDVKIIIMTVFDKNIYYNAG